jgi:probable F420-dependent oxidoreductase
MLARAAEAATLPVSQIHERRPALDFGISMFVTDYSMNVADVGRAAEEHGFESMFIPEHTHIPASRRSPWPGGPELPREYSHSLDPFLALSAVAAVTRTLKLGTGICLVIERDPITLAKEVATLDYLSNGRVLFGIGGGWNYEEMENHGTKPSLRWKILRERILAMKQIWTHDEAEYHGQFVNFDPIWQWPKPVQKPHPPVIIGGNGPRVLERVLEYGDGWLPHGHGGETDPLERIAELRRREAGSGRGPIAVTVWSPARDKRLIEEYEKLGVERCVLGLAAAPADEILPRLAHYARFASRFG